MGASSNGFALAIVGEWTTPLAGGPWPVGAGLRRPVATWLYTNAPIGCGAGRRAPSHTVTVVTVREGVLTTSIGPPYVDHAGRPTATGVGTSA